MYCQNIKRIAVIGLGYVGLSTAVGLSSLGYSVVGVDVDEKKVSDLNKKHLYIKNAFLRRAFNKAFSNGSFMATTNYAEAIDDGGIAFICVPTPYDADKGVDLNYLLEAINSIISVIINKRIREYMVVIKSTIPPTTTQNVLIPILRQNLKETKVNICVNPEFLREHSCLKDFLNPEIIVIGCEDDNSFNILKHIYDPIIKRRKTKIFKTDYTTAELIKYAFNKFHALKISFILELTQLARKVGANIFDISNILVSDRRLNISSAYLKPGFSFGGPCLPKDLRSFIHFAKNMGVKPILAQAILETNENFKHIIADDIISVCKQRGIKNVGIIGIGYANKADDVRESASVDLLYLILPYVDKMLVYDHYLSELSKELLVEKLSTKKLSFTKTMEDLIQKTDMIVLVHKYVELEDIIACLKKMQRSKKLILYDLTGYYRKSPYPEYLDYISAFIR